MNKSLNFHIKKYNLLSKDICQSITKQLDILDVWQQHEYHDTGNNSFVNNGEQELSVTWHNSVIGYNVVMETIFSSLQHYMSDIQYPWYSLWSGYTPVRWNKYSTGTLMSNHCDHIHTMFDGTRRGIPTLSVLGILNNEYEGGELVFFEDEIYNVEVGDLIVFPSNFLYPHRVNTVTKGTRYSFVSWVW